MQYPHVFLPTSALRKKTEIHQAIHTFPMDFGLLGGIFIYLLHAVSQRKQAFFRSEKLYKTVKPLYLLKIRNRNPSARS